MAELTSRVHPGEGRLTMTTTTTHPDRYTQATIDGLIETVYEILLGRTDVAATRFLHALCTYEAAGGDYRNGPLGDVIDDIRYRLETGYR